MADTTPPPTTVTDKRLAPRGVLPRRLQMWLMVALALGMLAIIALTGQSRPPARNTAPPAVESQTPNADRLRDYQDRLRALDARTAQARLVESQAPAPPARPVVDEPSGAGGESRIPSPKSAGGANTRVCSPRTSSSAGGPSRNGSCLIAGPTALPWNRLLTVHRATSCPSPPSLDAVADAVVRASAKYPPPSGGQQTADNNPAGAQPFSASGSAATKRTRPAGPGSDAGPQHRLLEGTVIDTVLVNRLDGGAAAPVNCLVTTPVYSQDGQVLLIPSGSRILGETKPVQSFGESRLAVAFDRLLLPDGRAYDLDHFVGLNEIGDAGLRDQVDQHYRSTFGASAAVGLLTGLAQSLTSWGTNRTSNTVVIAGRRGRRDRASNGPDDEPLSQSVAHGHHP